MLVLCRREAEVTTTTVSRDIRWLAAVNTNGTARLWTLRQDELLAQARRIAGRNLRIAEWEECFPGEPYRRTFPDLPAGH